MLTDEQLHYLRGTKGKETPYRAIASTTGLSTDSIRGRVSRYRRQLLAENEGLKRENQRLRAELDARDDVFGNDLGKAWELAGDWIIAGDVHANTINREFMMRPLEIAERYLERPRRFLLAGDFFNADAFSDYDNLYPLPSFKTELQAARAFLELYQQVFDEVWIIPGNHDYRVTKKTGTAIQMEDLIRMVSHDPRIHVSHWGHAVIKTARGDYRVTHGSDFSVQQLNVADQLALKYDQHIIGWHQHHCAIGLSRWKRHIVIDGGGLFDQSSMAYTQIEDNKKPMMANGFVLLRNGYPYVFNDMWTDWSFWLDKAARKVAA